METLRSLYERIPKRVRLWILSFLLGLFITLIWGVGVLLSILLLLFFISYLFNALGNREARAVGQWSITQYFKRIRGMILFALLPTAWELIKNPSIDSIVAIVILVFVALSIWDKFDQIMNDVIGKAFRPQRRRRRLK